MKKIYFILFILIATRTLSFSQITFNVVGGVSPKSSPSNAGLIVNRNSPHDEFVFNMNEVGPQYFGGIQARFELGSPFFVNAGLNYTKKESTYQLNYTLIDTEHPVSNHIMLETEHLLLLPVNLGVQLGDFDVTSGFRAIHSIAHKTDLFQLPGFNTKNNFLQLGWQTGIGYNFFGTRIGIEYNSHFSRVGKGMSVNGQSLELMNVPGQFAFNIQRSF